MKSILLRIDDVGGEDRQTTAALTALVEAGFPFTCLVVPAWITSTSADFLRRLAGAADIDIVQHGYRHDNHAPPGQRKYEFGPSRSAAEQAADLRAGRHVLENFFGPAWPRIFAPPHDRLDQTTLDVLHADGFTMGLGAPGTFAGLRIPPGLVTFEFALDASVRTGEQRRPRPADEIIAAIEAREGSVSEHLGLIVHPREYEDLGEFRELLHALDSLRRVGVRFSIISQLSAHSDVHGA